MSTPAISPERGRREFSWKRLFIKAAGLGAGAALMVWVIGASIWYMSRPKPQKPWDNQSIKAEFYRVDQRGNDDSLEFFYLLENTTNQDYKLENGNSILLAVVLEDTGGLTGFEKADAMKLSYPVFVPRRQKTRITLRLNSSYGFRERLKDYATSQEIRAYRAKLEEHLRTKVANLNGFKIFDEACRYEIILPAGWKRKP